MNIFIEDKIKAKDLIINIDPKNLHVQIKGQEPLIKGEWFENIAADSSVWTIEDGEIQ